MIYPITITGSDMRSINRSAVLEIIRRESPISRTTISERLKLSLATVMRIVDGLVEEGFVRLQGETEWSGGRRRPLLEFNADGFVVLGADLGGTKLYGAISNLGGTILDEIYLERHDTTSEESYQHLTSLVDQLLASPHLEGRRVRGLGVGVPGVTLHKEGIVKWAYNFSWRDFPLKARLESQYDLSITVDNDVNLAALGELWFGEGQNAQSMVAIIIDVGIGAGIIIDRSLYRGAREASGEIGNMIPGREFLGRDFRYFGALESVASGTGIANRAGDAGQGTIHAEQVLEATRQGQAWAVEITADMVDYLAIAITNIMVTIDPEVIILSGGVVGYTDLLLEPILKRINGTIPVEPRVVSSELGRRAIVMGAIINVLHNTSNFYVVHKLS
jgi:predicted NBD/HSP70 family sugar kinase